MKRLLILVAVILAFGLSSLAYAESNMGHNDQWRHQHAQMWKTHSKEWVVYDRQWAAHQRATPEDIRWRRDHARLWHDWYAWHQDERDDGEHSGLSIHLNIDF